MSEITTAEELDALPIGSVVLDGMGDAWQRSDADTDWWAPANPFYDEADAANVLEQGGTEHPATLLYRPDRPSDLAGLRAGIEGLAGSLAAESARAMTARKGDEASPQGRVELRQARVASHAATRLRALLDGWAADRG